MRRRASIRQTAVIAGVSEVTIRKWIAGGKLKATPRVAGNRLSVMVDVEAARRLAKTIRRGPTKDRG